jgi:trehalose synthase-fused probable maltokinase
MPPQQDKHTQTSGTFKQVIEQLAQARWFSGKSRSIRDARVVDRASWVGDTGLCLIEVNYADGPSEIYVVADRFEEPAVARALLSQFTGPAVPTEAGGTVVFRPTHVFASIPTEQTEPIAVLRGEQSNTSIRFGDALILKLFRRFQLGPNPDVEVGWFLTEHSHFRGTPALVGSVEYTSSDHQTASLALLQRFEPNRGDAWMTMLNRVHAVLDGGDDGESLAAITRLAETTADLHLALASGEGDFSAERIISADADIWERAIRDEVQIAAEGLARRGIQIDAAALLRRAVGIRGLIGATKARHHGDYHLGQVLEREDGSFAIIDFEGEPSKPLAQRREKRSPLRDVAGMLRSFDYARHAALRAAHTVDELRVGRAATWYERARTQFVGRYLSTVERANPHLLPSDIAAPLAALELEKAAYEVLYELNNRPDWLPIPLAALEAA